ncbi:MAG: hypothetical protein ABH854_04320 [Candidatus Diapherotrites archaeon]
MTRHDSGEKVLKEPLEKRQVSSFDELNLEVAEIREQSKDPFFLSTLLYKLAKEREETNKLLSGINEKYDKIMFELKTGKMDKTEVLQSMEDKFEMLPEQDQLILNYIEEGGSGSAKEIKDVMRYKGLNAASQRLNKLYKEGYLKKVQSGKQVLYLVKG